MSTFVPGPCTAQALFRSAALATTAERGMISKDWVNVGERTRRMLEGWPMYLVIKDEETLG